MPMQHNFYTVILQVYSITENDKTNPFGISLTKLFQAYENDDGRNNLIAPDAVRINDNDQMINPCTIIEISTLRAIHSYL